MPIPDMDAYSQNFQYSAKSFFGCQYSNFVNLCLKLGVETVEAIILIILGVGIAKRQWACIIFEKLIKSF